MQHDEFIGLVQDRARLASRGEAERATRATLESLGERLPQDAAENLAAQLPHEIGEHLRRSSADLEKLDYGEFVERVTVREGAETPEAVYHARVVVELVDEATSGGSVDRVRDQLPEDFAPLFAGSSGRAS